MKCMLNIAGVGKTYVFESNGFLWPFFKAYFGSNVRKVDTYTKVAVVVAFKIHYTGDNEILLRHDECRYSLSIPAIKIFRAFIRSMYQLMNPNSNTIGLFEYFVYLIRKSFLEPLELELATNAYLLIHGAVLSKNTNDAILLVAGSQGGKSTVSKMLGEQGFRIVGDNYAFFNGDKVMTVPECRRYGKPRRFAFSFYAKGVHDAPKPEWLKIRKVFILSFADRFAVTQLTRDSVKQKLISLYMVEKEGCFHHEYGVVESNFNQFACNLQSNDLFELTMIKDLEKTEQYLKELFCD